MNKTKILFQIFYDENLFEKYVNKSISLNEIYKIVYEKFSNKMNEIGYQLYPDGKLLDRLYE